MGRVSYWDLVQRLYQLDTKKGPLTNDEDKEAIAIKHFLEANTTTFGTTEIHEYGRLMR